LLKEHEGKVKVLAGGTDLLPSMKQRLFTPEYVLDLRQIPGLGEIEDNFQKGVRIGSLSTLAAIEESPVVKGRFPALAEAAGLVGATQLRNMGTIGGNIALETRCWYFNQSHSWRRSIERCIKLGGKVCHVVKRSKKQCYAYFAADTVPILVALNAEVTIKGNGKGRQCLLKDIYTQEGKNSNTLKPTEVISEVLVPLPDPGSGSSYKKLRIREAIDFPLVGAAVQVVMSGDICRDAKIVLGAVGSGPIEVTEAESVLRGNPITEELIEEVGKISQKAAKPMPNAVSTPEYRRKMAGLLTKQALREAVNRANILE